MNRFDSYKTEKNVIEEDQRQLKNINRTKKMITKKMIEEDRKITNKELID